MNDIKSVLHLYLNHQVQVRKKNDFNRNYLTGRICEVTCNSNHGDWVKVWFDRVETITNTAWNQLSSNSHTFFMGEDEIKPILSRLSDMTEEDAIELIQILFKENSDDSRIQPEEIDINMVPGDGGLMVDGDMALVIEVSCRCYEGQLCIRNCGSILLFDEIGAPERIHNQPQAYAYLLSKGYWLFGDEAFDSGIIIDKKTWTNS